MTNSIIKVIITLLLALTLANIATALTINAPTTIAEGQLLTVEFITTANMTTIQKDGILVSNTTTYSENLSYNSAGLITFTFSTSNESENRTIEILDIPLSMQVQQPAATDYSSQVPVVLTTSRPVDLCYVTSDTGTLTLNKITPTSYNLTISLDEGIQVLSIKCKHENDLITINKTINVDTTPPTIILTPSGTVIEYPLTLKATTEEISTCTYGLKGAPAREYEPMNSADNLIHEATLYLGSGNYQYNTICEDVLGNSIIESTTFQVNRDPSAVIKVEGSNPHKAGTYEIEVEVSEPLQEPPVLKLIFDNGGTRNIPLQIEDPLLYSGVLIIAEDEGERVGSFSFSGTSLTGRTGTTIDDAPLFIVDTIKPDRVNVFTASNSSRGINLSWFYDGGEDVHFNIYRTTGEEVTYTSYYAQGVGDSYQDYDVTSAVTYYYRIAAVDDAGNIGELSTETKASPAIATFKAEKKEQLLDPLLQVMVDSRINDVDIWILDAEQIVEDLKAETGEIESRLLLDLSILADAQQSLADLRKARQELIELKKLYLAESELQQRLSQIYETAKDARDAIPLSVEITNKFDYEETPNPDAITAAAQELSLPQKEITRIMDIARIQVSQYHVTIEYSNQERQQLTIVDKKISLPESRTEIIVLESLPSTIKPPPIFIGTKPVAIDTHTYRFSYTTFKEERILYTLEGTIDAPVLRGSRAIIAQQQQEIQEQAPSSPTGNAILPDLSFLSSSYTWAIILGVIVLGVLVFYYFKLDVTPPIQSSTPNTVLTQPNTQPSLPSLQTILVERKETPLAQLLLNAHKFIDDNKYMDALYFYKQALQHSSQPSSPKVAAAVKDELNIIYTKLCLSREMSLAHDAIYAEDTVALENAMENMRTHASAIDDETCTLLLRAQQNYRYFYAQWNSLQADKHNLDQEQDL